MPVFDWECVVVPPVLVNWIYGPVGTLGDHQHVAGSLVVICWVKLEPTVEPGDGELIVIVGGDVSFVRVHDAVVPPLLPKHLHLYSVEVSATSWNIPEVQLFNVLPHWPLIARATHTPSSQSGVEAEQPVYELHSKHASAS